MRNYDDRQNRSGLKLLFMLVQMIVVMVVFAFLYMSFAAIKLGVQYEGVSEIMYLPLFGVLFLFPVLLYRYRTWFNAGRMLYAYSWTMASASIIIVMLYAYIDQIVG